MKYSVIIKNGAIFDGTGNQSKKADIAIEKEKIAKIGDLQKEEAGLIIDASQLYISPGFIDLTTHSDNHWTIFSQPSQESFIRQGVTTILGGHGGSSLAPFVKRGGTQSFGRWIDPAQININWQTTKEFFSELEKHNLAVNFATLVGHETLRRNILNDDARPAGKEEVKEINNLLEMALKEGAFGLSTNFKTPHAQAASENEILLLLETTTKHNAISVHHLENEGKDLLPAISRLIMFLRKSGCRGHIAHFKALGRTAWENFENALNMIELAQKEEIFLTCDFFPYTSTGSNLASFLPAWILSENKEKILALLKENGTRQNLIDYLKNLTLHYEKIIVASTARDTSSVGKSIKQISQNLGLSEEEATINLLEINDLRVSIFNDVILEKNIEILSKKSYSMVASDGVGYKISKIPEKQKDLPHPRSFGSFPRAFAELVKKKKILTWEEAIHKMSGLPAATLGIKDRGILQKDNYADIVIFNPGAIKDKATYENPFQYPEGIEFVFINGALAFAENKLTENRSGRVLRRKF
jgi:N-acyl-D-aspartate/D-glutamate deacylase